MSTAAYSNPLHESNSQGLAGLKKQGPFREEEDGNRPSFEVDPKTGKSFIVISKLPQDIQYYLQPFDFDGHGTVDSHELMRIGNEQKSLRHIQRSFRHTIYVMIFIMLIMVGMTFGLSFAVYKISTVVTLDGGGVLKSQDMSQTVQTASHEFRVVNDMLSDRASLHPVKTAAADYFLTNANSSWPNEVFRHLEAVSVEHSSGAHVSLAVQGFMRVISAQHPGGSYITLLTAAGEVDLIADQWSVSAEVAAVLQRAGFDSNPTATRTAGLTVRAAGSWYEEIAADVNGTLARSWGVQIPP